MIEQVPLWARPWVSIPGAMRLLGKSRESVMRLIDSGKVKAVQDGARIKVVTQSIRDYVENEATAQLAAVGLKGTQDDKN